jgi:hypothetical protein
MTTATAKTTITLRLWTTTTATTAKFIFIGLVLSIVLLLLLGTEETTRYLVQWKITVRTTSYYIQQQELPPPPQQQQYGDGCDLIDATSSYIPQWRNYTQQETDEVQSLRQCIQTLGNIPNTVYRTVILAVRSQHQILEESKLHCNIQVNLRKIQDTMKQYNVVWFFGDSIMLQQFYLMVCMIDPHLGMKSGKPFNITKNPNDVSQDTSFVWYHSNNNNNSTATTIKYSHFGLVGGGSEANLYKRDFPMAANTLGSNDAIILTAAAHYDSSRVHLYQRAVTHIATMSIQSNASVFYMEPTPEEWPTGNGMWVPNCQWACQCEALNPSRLIGQGNYSDPTVPYDAKNKQTVSIIPILNRVYPDLAFANNTKDCYPSCLPATYRWT